MLSSVSFAIAAVFAAAFAYMVLAVIGVVRFGRALGKKPQHSGNWTPVTVLKPLCGDEPELYENLKSFCEQDYPSYQVVFGVRDAADPAIAVAERLIAEFPAKDLALVVDERVIGRNLKVSNLANMMRRARHELIVVADSDMRVGRGYLTAVAGVFDDARAGAATCLYSGAGASNLASRLGAMFINDWFLPSALIPTMFGELKFCFGATMAVRRSALKEIGGFEALADVLADDYMLGHLVSQQGHKVALAPYVVENRVHEAGLKALFRHETRWARTIRSVQPGGYALSFVTEALALSLLAAAATYHATQSVPLAAVPVAATLTLRWTLHFAAQRKLAGGRSFSPWLIPLRDALSLAVRVGSFFGRGVSWRGQEMTVHADSRLDPLTSPRAARPDELEAPR
jgi:ceramide glucosyltransferase